MAYETDVAATSDDLLDAFCDFCVANAGYTRHTNLPISGAGIVTDCYILQKGGIYYWFEVLLETQTGYGDVAQLTCKMMLELPTRVNQNDTSKGQYFETRMTMYNRPNGPFISHRFYADADGANVHMVLELSPNVFGHLSIGKVTKFGSWVGGEYLTAVCLQKAVYSVSVGWRSYLFTSNGSGIYPGYCTAGHNSDIFGFSYVYNPIRAQGNGKDFAFCSTTTTGDETTDFNMGKWSGTTDIGGLNSDNPMRALFPDAIPYVNYFNNRAPLIPTYLFLNDSRLTIGTDRLFIAGYIPNVAFSRIDLIEPQAIIEVDWDSFPLIQKAGDPFSYPVTGPGLGINYKRIP